MICQGTGCTNTAIAGASFCSEDHFEELEHERRSRNGFRTATPLNGKDYTADLKSPKHVSVRVEADNLKPKEPLPQYMNKAADTVKKPGETPKREPLTDDRLRELRKLGLSYGQIEKKTGVKWQTVGYRCKKLGIAGTKYGNKTGDAMVTPTKDFPPMSPIAVEVSAPAPSTSIFASVIEDLERQRERLTAQLKAIEQAIEALRKVS